MSVTFRFANRLAQIFAIGESRRDDATVKHDLDYYDTELEDFLSNLSLGNAPVGIDVYGAAQTIDLITSTTYTVLASDVGHLKKCYTTTTCTVTLVKNATAMIDPGKWVEWLQVGAGVVSLVAESGATVHGYPTAKTGGQYARLFSQKDTDVDTWWVGGATAAT